MRKTKSGKAILTKAEHTEQERLEMIEAKKKALLQEDQRQKRLWYLPMILELLAIAVIVGMIYSVGFFSSEALKEECKECPVVRSVCELPITGADPLL